MHTEFQVHTQPRISGFDAIAAMQAPLARRQVHSADGTLRTPDEAQEMLARDWEACELQAIRMGCYCVW